MRSHATPREVLGEIKRAKHKPWWATKLFEEIEEHLERRGLLDLYMSPQSVEDLLEEAVDTCRRPMTGAEMAADLERIAKKAGLH